MTTHSTYPPSPSAPAAHWANPWPSDLPVPWGEHSVQAFLSEGVRQVILKHVLAASNSRHRTQRWQEFFAALDWLPVSEISNSPLRQLPPTEQRLVLTDVEAYLASKQQAREQNQAQRKDYQQRIIEYFRKTVPPADKALLESLRDYELALTGRDVNWQHHFALRSFKRIDEFVNADRPTRLGWVASFREDVLTYKRNLEKIQQNGGTYPLGDAEDAAAYFSFDDWCEQHGSWSPETARASDSAGRQRQTQDGASHQTQDTSAEATLHALAISAALKRAFELLELPVSAPLSAVKRQFRQLTLRYHPDVCGGDPRRMQQIIEAYQQVSQWCQQQRSRSAKR
ncbi:MAG: J domain-containing protein [Candidatus Melainabacteria bacterium]|nr:J domain-containing protein [Candidatus Melainabacteria bacterium]